ncbi:MAG: acyltransferase family protein, partial [Maricaulaceae bacterium]
MTITQKATSHVRFRTDIEGLRALAVLAVVINHAGFSALPGGFLGVDIFFVISGFLITRNICRDLDAGKFKFGAFFGRRIRRLFPALVATVIVTLCISYLLLTPRLALSTAKSAISAVISLSNIWFLSEVSYFDSLATQKPLLHTWSLGVEEQFYLIWPFLLLLAGSLVGRRGYIIMMAGFGLLSLIAAQIWLLKSPSATFYLTHFRLFEFAIGGLIAALYPKGVRKKFATSIWCIGLIITFSSLIMFDKTTPMPGAWSLVPCLGVAMIIMA